MGQNPGPILDPDASPKQDSVRKDSIHGRPPSGCNTHMATACSPSVSAILPPPSSSRSTVLPRDRRESGKGVDDWMLGGLKRRSLEKTVIREDEHAAPSEVC